VNVQPVPGFSKNGSPLLSIFALPNDYLITER
jgi:hypothetical protein